MKDRLLGVVLLLLPVMAVGAFLWVRNNKDQDLPHEIQVQEPAPFLMVMFFTEEDLDMIRSIPEEQRAGFQSSAIRYLSEVPYLQNVRQVQVGMAGYVIRDGRNIGWARVAWISTNPGGQIDDYWPVLHTTVSADLLGGAPFQVFLRPGLTR